MGGYVDISQNGWYSPADLPLTYVSGMVLLYGASRVGRLHGALARRIAWIGRNAMHICCIHTVVLTVGPWDTYRLVIQNAILPGIIGLFIIHTIVAVGGCKILAYMQHRVWN